MPDPASGMKRYYLVLLDAVPGGTGYLKTLYQDKDSQQRDGEGIMQVLRLAKNALETCVCRQMRQEPNRQDTDGFDEGPGRATGQLVATPAQTLWRGRSEVQMTNDQ